MPSSILKSQAEICAMSKRDVGSAKWSTRIAIWQTTRLSRTWQKVVERAQAAGLTQALCILAAENPTEAERARELTRIWPALRFGVGLHPHQAGPVQRPRHRRGARWSAASSPRFPRPERSARSASTITTISRPRTCSRTSSGCRSGSRASWICPSSFTPAKPRTTRSRSCARKAAARCAA